MLSTLTAADMPVENVESVLATCGGNHYCAALVCMLQAAVGPQLEDSDKKRLLEVHTYLYPCLDVMQHGSFLIAVWYIAENVVKMSTAVYIPPYYKK